MAPKELFSKTPLTHGTTAPQKKIPMNTNEGNALDIEHIRSCHSQRLDLAGYDIGRLCNEIQYLRTKLQQANDAAAKGDKARLAAAGMEMEIGELRGDLAVKQAELMLRLEEIAVLKSQVENADVNLECGHTTTEDGCAFCIQQRVGELEQSIQTCLKYPRGSEAQIRCLEEIGQSNQPKEE